MNDFIIITIDNIAEFLDLLDPWEQITLMLVIHNNQQCYRIGNLSTSFVEMVIREHPEYFPKIS